MFLDQLKNNLGSVITSYLESGVGLIILLRSFYFYKHCETIV